jgi:hypothetical protein
MRGFLLAALFVLLTACAASTRVGRGQLFSPGDGRYDAYFKQVHDIQLYVATWSDEKRGTRKPLREALQLLPDASDSTISHAAQDRVKSLGGPPPKLVVNGDTAQVVAGAGAKSDPTLFKGVEETARAELERVGRLRALEIRLEDLQKQGLSLEEGVDEAFRDENKQREVKHELSESISVLRQLAVQAKRQARDGEDFVADLQAALSGEVTIKHGDTKPLDKPLPPATSVASSPAPAPPPPPPPAAVPVASVAPPTSPLPPPPPPPLSDQPSAAVAPPPAPAPTAAPAHSATKPKPKPKPGGKKPGAKPKPSGGDGEVFNP